ncbi:hypothetical protein [Zhihengliuella salsuginis]|uniref:CHRD domain-containing protein n=1 Tax=Zhihengliuella salsuginis TaxID=578222 RepID=A0ABQ3GAB2_9MICC|nr:hypothetical protein [Zhihengliuella salsuginis]GHC99314.1 hypothetical protein GCM10008096_01330 [Zhihengliuella salsuginis]
MKKLQLLAVPTLALGMLAAAATGASADTHAETYQAELEELNGSGGSGSTMIRISGDQATVSQEVSGLAETFDGNPYPHVQHIHITTDTQGQCPTPDADENGDGIVDTPEGGPSYGMVGTTLSTSGDTSAGAATDLTVAGMGGSFSFERTFTMNAETIEAIEAGNGTVVVHGLDPATLSEEAAGAMSTLAPELPLAATAPALCGTLTASQMDMPIGNPETGGGNTAGMDSEMIALGGGLVLVAAGAGVYMVRRRQAGQG